MAKLMDRLRGYLGDAGRAFQHAPVEVALALFAAIMLSIAIEIDGLEAWAEVAIATALSMAIAWIATLLFGMRAISERQRWGITLGGAIAAGIYGGFIIDVDRSAEGWRAAMLLLAAALAVLATPAWPRNEHDSNLRLRRISGRFLLRFIGLTLYGLALFAGLALAIKAVDTLFELKLQGELYGHVFGWIMLVIVPWVVIGGIDEYLRSPEQGSDLMRVVHRLVTYLVPPLLALYYVILYAYAVRIAITGEFPKNLVSPMVIAAGLLGCIALVLFDPGAESSGMRRVRIAPPLFLPLAPLGFWALAPRVRDYGWTEFRLLRLELLAVLFVLALLATVQLFRRRTLELRLIPSLFAASIALAVIGPWSALAISRRDQQQRLREALRAESIDPTVIPSKSDTTHRTIPATSYDRINGSANYLRRAHGESALASILPARARRIEVVSDLAGYYRLLRRDSAGAQRYLYGQLAPGQAARVDSITVAYRVTASGSPRDGLQAHMVGDTVRMIIGQRSLFADLGPIVRNLATAGPARGELPPGSAVVPVLDIAGKQQGRLLILSINVQSSSGNRDANHLDGVLLLKEVPR